MAFVSAKERFQDRTIDWSIEARKYSRTWLVETDDKNTSPVDVVYNVTIPKIGQAHPNDAFAYAESVSARPVQKTSRYFLVTVPYSTRTPRDIDPNNDAARVQWDSEQFQEVAVYDNGGELILNSAGDPFDPPAMKDMSRISATVKKNLTFVPTWLLDYPDAVNSDAFVLDNVDIPPRIAKIQKVTVAEDWQERNFIKFREVTFLIHFRPEKWLLEILDAGFREKDATKRKNMKNDGDAERPTAPIPLDGAGKMLADPSPSNATFLEFKVYDEKPFSILPLV